MQDIFLQYTLGASLKEIAEQMRKTGPVYDEGQELEQEHDRTNLGKHQVHWGRQLSEIS